jgi:hypothetical protein
VNKLVRHRPRSSAIILFKSGERIAVSISPSGIVVEKLRLRVARRPLLQWRRNDPKHLDRAIVFFMSGPASDLPGDSVLELITTRFLRECYSINDVVSLCRQIS